MPKLLKYLSLAATLAMCTAPLARAEGFAGSFLAANSANIANDYTEAAYYYTQAMIAEPENGFIMQGAMFAYVATGDVSTAAMISRKMADAGFKDEYAHTVMIAAALAKDDYAAALLLLTDLEFNINPLVRRMVTGWSLVGSGELNEAYAQFSADESNETLAAFGLYNKGLALAHAGNFAAANEVFSAGGAYVNRGSLMAHAQILAELGRSDEALALLVDGPGRAFADRETDGLRQRLANGEPVRFDRALNPQDGVAEVFMVLGDALNSDDSQRLALLYSRLSQFLQSDNASASLLVGDILTEQGQYHLALESYNTVPDDDAQALSAKIGRAQNLRDNDDLDGAIVALQSALELKPDELTLWQFLGDFLRQNHQPNEALSAYSASIDLLPNPDVPAAWILYYSRAIVAHTAGDWPSAEADFRQALKLNPDQADVLNYLGYSLVERGEKLDEALQMIETAVDARPDSGAIADSLGWVYYQLGRYEDARKAMEIAVILLPVDPVLSDHYGDVLWMVNRKREANFQWRRALSYGPDEADAGRIRAKLEQGLDAVLASE